MEKFLSNFDQSSNPNNLDKSSDLNQSLGSEPLLSPDKSLSEKIPTPPTSTPEEIAQMPEKKICNEIIKQIEARPSEINGARTTLESIAFLISNEKEYIEVYKRIIDFEKTGFDGLDQALASFMEWRKKQADLIQQAEKNNQPDRANAIAVVGSVFSNLAQGKLAQRSVEKQRFEKNNS